MKEDVSIKVKIADRIFPIKVSTQEEFYVRKAVKHIDQKIKEIRAHYGIKEYKDVLAMIALELATEQAKFESRKWIEDDGISEKVDQIDDILTAYNS
ncbi:cell division protein ZapA [bacterium]|nr:cell division protein ZapA [bacterium]